MVCAFALQEPGLGVTAGAAANTYDDDYVDDDGGDDGITGGGRDGSGGDGSSGGGGGSGGGRSDAARNGGNPQLEPVQMAVRGRGSLAFALLGPWLIVRMPLVCASWLCPRVPSNPTTTTTTTTNIFIDFNNTAGEPELRGTVRRCLHAHHLPARHPAAAHAATGPPPRRIQPRHAVSPVAV